jgi:hypothetical protein
MGAEVAEPVKADTVSLLRYRGDELSLRAAVLIETMQNTNYRLSQQIMELERLTQCVCDED